MAGARSHKDLICWQRAYELKLLVYELLRTGTVTRDLRFRDQLRESASSAPRLIAEGFGRYYPGEFSRYLRLANGELKETIESLDDGVDRRALHARSDHSAATSRKTIVKGCVLLRISEQWLPRANQHHPNADKNRVEPGERNLPN